MATASPRALRQSIEQRTFDPVYHLTGQNDFLKEEALALLLAAAVDPATRDFNLEIRRGSELDAEMLASLLATPPMMAERRAVVVRDPSTLRKDARVALDRYLDRPQADTMIVLLSPADSKSDRFTSATTVEYRALSDDEVVRWIEHQVQRHGGGISQEAATLLFEAVGNDLPQLAQEIDKLVSYSGSVTIDADAVADAVGIRRGETLADLLDRIAARDAAGSLELLPVVLGQPKNSAVFIVMALTTQVLAMAWARAQKDAGMRSIDGALFGFLKENRSSMVARPWGDAVRTWSRCVDSWSASHLDAALAALLAADRALKESRVSTEEEILESLILELCAHGGRVRRERAA